MVLSGSSKVRLVVFDWAGTVVDFGSRAPVAAFVQTFAAQGVALTEAEARGPMGLPKRDHLQALLSLPAVRQRWRQAHGHDPTQADLAALYDRFLPTQLAVLPQYNALIPGALDCVGRLRRQGIRIGVTTGYFRAAAAEVREAAARQGFVAEQIVCPDDVAVGRPAPWMIYRLMEALDVSPPSAVVKVGDTVADVAEGLNAGVWSVGVTRGSSEVGLGEQEFNALPVPERQDLLSRAAQKLREAGAHAVIETLAELPDLLADLPG
jgi:phosphonoacetaldehyde hydrolase